MDFKPIETQEQFDQMIQDRITRAKDKVREEYSDYEDMKQQVSDYQKKVEDLTSQLANVDPAKDARISELEKQVSKYETDSVKIRAALKFGIPYEMASRISGADEESIMKDAESIAPLFKTKTAAPLATETKAMSGVDGSLLALSKKLTER